MRCLLNRALAHVVAGWHWAAWFAADCFVPRSDSCQLKIETGLLGRECIEQSSGGGCRGLFSEVRLLPEVCSACFSYLISDWKHWKVKKVKFRVLHLAASSVAYVPFTHPRYKMWWKEGDLWGFRNKMLFLLVTGCSGLVWWCRHLVLESKSSLLG